MKTSALIAMIAIFSVAPAVLGQAKGNAEEGKDAFMKHCAACHAADGNGKPTVAKLLNVTFLPLGGKEVQSLSDADLRKIITEGKDKMKPVKDVSKSDIANLIAFVRTLKK